MRPFEAVQSLRSGEVSTPVSNLITVGILLLLIAMFTFYQMTRQPWIGAHFIPAPKATGMIVKSVHPNSPADGVLVPGVTLLSISDGTHSIPLNPIILEEPNNLPSYALFNRSLGLQDDIWKILLKKKIQFETSSGEILHLQIKATRPLSAIPTVFWFYPVIASIGVFLGMLVGYRNPQLTISWLILGLGWVYFLGMMGMMLIDRELALSQSHLKLLLAIENFSTNLFVAALLAIFYSFPSKILPEKSYLMFFFFAILIPLNSTFQWLELPNHAFLFHFMFVHLALYFALWLQWKSAKLNPINKAMLLWALLWMAVPTLSALLIFVVPTIVGIAPLLPIEAARLIMALYSVGLVLGVLKYQLFDVERWWFVAMLWLAGGALVVLIDFLFVLFLHLQPASAITLSLIVAGLLYFPMRQWLLQKILPGQQQTAERRITQSVSSLIANKQDLTGDGWTNMLSNYFSPVEVRQNNRQVPKTQLIDHGLSLLIPGQPDGKSLMLSGKNHGKKLFNPVDVQHVHALYTLTQLVNDAEQVATQAAQAERKRIMRDLHDTMGAQLLTLIHRSKDKDYTEDVRSTLHSLRKTVQLLSKSKPVPLEELVAEWRTELLEKTDHLNIQLEWPLPKNAHQGEKIPLRQALLISHLARESLITATLKLQPVKVRVELVNTIKTTYLIVSLNLSSVSQATSKTNQQFLDNLKSSANALNFELFYTPDLRGDICDKLQILLKLNPH